ASVVHSCLGEFVCHLLVQLYTLGSAFVKQPVSLNHRLLQLGVVGCGRHLVHRFNEHLNVVDGGVQTIPHDRVKVSTVVGAPLSKNAGLSVLPSRVCLELAVPPHDEEQDACQHERSS